MEVRGTAVSVLLAVLRRPRPLSANDERLFLTSSPAAAGRCCWVQFYFLFIIEIRRVVSHTTKLKGLHCTLFFIEITAAFIHSFIR
jgi:hypothetical protein